MTPVRIQLSSGASRNEALAHIARLVAEGVPWDAVDWQIGTRFEEATAAWSPPASLSGLDPAFLQTCAAVLLHAAPDRHLRIHRMVERLLRQPAAWQDVLHPEHRRLLALERQVRRERHKMKAFVRFTKVPGPEGAGAADDPQAHCEYVAWFEPTHYVVQSLGDFFRRRFAAMRWSILTPHGSLRWDGQELQLGPAAHPSQAPPPDAGEALWLSYYARIFNPARIKLAAMRKEMPVRYWKNLPETRQIGALLAEAPERVAQMVAHAERASRWTRDPDRAALVAREPEPAGPVLARCLDCAFAHRATQPVASEGAANARVVIVGDQPDSVEDLSGRAFVGPAGQLLRSALLELGVGPETVRLTYAVRHFKYVMRGRQRIPDVLTAEDLGPCSRWLREELVRCAPRGVIALGRNAQRALAAVADALPPGVRVDGVAHPMRLLQAGEALGSPGHRRWTQALGRLIAQAEDAPQAACDAGCHGVPRLPTAPIAPNIEPFAAAAGLSRSCQDEASHLPPSLP